MKPSSLSKRPVSKALTRLDIRTHTETEKSLNGTLLPARKPMSIFWNTLSSGRAQNRSNLTRRLMAKRTRLSVLCMQMLGAHLSTVALWSIRRSSRSLISTRSSLGKAMKGSANVPREEFCDNFISGLVVFNMVLLVS